MIFHRSLQRSCRICPYDKECDSLDGENELYQRTICERMGAPSFIKDEEARGESYLNITYEPSSDIYDDIEGEDDNELAYEEEVGC